MEVSEIPSTTQYIAIVILFILCWLIESFSELEQTRLKIRHFSTNFKVSIGGIFIQLILALIFIKIFILLESKDLGLLTFLGIESSIGIIVFTFIFLDLTYWAYHFLMHRIPILWHFHAIHHSDHTLDVSTTLREHPIETFIRQFHYLFFILVLVPPLWLVGLHQVIQVSSKIIIHGKYHLPKTLNKTLNLLFVTPNFHQIHHHHKRPYTDSNFGDLFSIWDRIFRTFKSKEPEEITYGLDSFPDQKKSPATWIQLLKYPFEKITKKR